LRYIIFCFTILATLAGPCAAAENFDAFYARFKSAMIKRDKSAVASMTKLPFLFDSKNLGKQQFITKFEQIFPKDTANCFKREKPVADRDSYSVFCGETIYVFSKVNGNYLFTDIGVND